MHSLTCTASRSRLAAGQGHDLDLLLTFTAPAPSKTATRQPICIVPVVDVSGSMQGAKLASVRLALKRLAMHLQPGDLLGLVTFDSEVQVPVPHAELTEARRLGFLAAASALKSGSSTNLAGGLLEAVDRLKARPAPPGVRARVLVLTDGLANQGPAQTPEELRALVKERFGEITLSAFGYGTDCDQALLGDLADAGGGSYAFIGSDDAVLTAFGRELGGLLATYASDIRVKAIPLAGAPIEERLGDLLHHGAVSTVVRVAVPAHAKGSLEVARIEVRWRDTTGAERLETLKPEVQFVPAAKADKVDLADVARARDERVLRQAQERAEDLSRAGDFAAAQAVLVTALGKLRDAKLIEFAKKEVLPLYEDGSAYSAQSGKRSSTYSALKRKRQLIQDPDVSAMFGVNASEAEKEMEESFKAEPGRKKKVH